MAKSKRTKRPALAPDHPMAVLGFLHESDVRDAWKLSDSYWREWLRKDQLPYYTIGGERWFQGESLVAWFNQKANRWPADDGELDSAARDQTIRETQPNANP
tara:strand:+ start:183 stop:488 length:306 start_codon:yes stop_codon:yes gene_type:complete